MIIAVDCDDVLRDMVPQCCKVYNQKYDIHANLKEEDIKSWTMLDYMPKAKDIYKFFIDNAAAIFYNSPIKEEYKDLVDKIKEEGHQVAIVTHQFKGIEYLTAQWLNNNNINYDSLHFSKNKNIVNADILIDDRLENCQRFSSYNKRAFCVDAPWNQEWEGIRVHNTDEVIDVLKRYRF